MTQPVPSKTLGRYRLDTIAGAGASAVVWRGTDVLLHRKVAVKVLKPDIATDAALVDRFFNEARAMAGLSDPAIVQIYDMLASGERALVMEYVDGPSLATLLARERVLEPARAVSIARDVARALRAAHAGGILHRDIKPANVLTTVDGNAKVTDFGLARAATQDGGATLAGGLVGSTHYMSPEQAQGLPLSPASDLYSLGVMLHQMLTGRLPFDGESPIAVALAHVRADVPGERELAQSMSRELAAIVHRLLAKDPAARFHRAADLDAALAVADVEPAPREQARAAWDAPTILGGVAAPRKRLTARPAQRLRAIVPLAVAAIAILIAGAGFAGFGRHQVAVANVQRFAAERARAVSTGPVREAVPDLTGKTGASARALLGRLALTAEAATRLSDAPVDTVFAQYPPAGTRVVRGSHVAIVVSAPHPARADVSDAEPAVLAPFRGHGHHRGRHGHHGPHDAG